MNTPDPELVRDALTLLARLQANKRAIVRAPGLSGPVCAPAFLGDDTIRSVVLRAAAQWHVWSSNQSFINGSDDVTRSVQGNMRCMGCGKRMFEHNDPWRD